MSYVDLPTLHEAGVLSTLDVHFAQAMVRLGAEPDERVALASALLSRQVQGGHVCLDLPRLCRDPLALEEPSAVLVDLGDLPALADWLSALRKSALVGDAEGRTPLLLDASGRLYLRRYFEHEQSLAHALLQRARQPLSQVAPKVLQEGLDRLFGRALVAPGKSQLDLFATPDLQRSAAQRAVERNLCVISGGPGTGKTSTVVKILALLVEQAHALGGSAPRVHLLAPTGKAAARLSEAIRRAKAALACTDDVRNAIHEDSSTIHRALGSFGSVTRFRHGRGMPLATDVVVVDEASMVDIALMARLFEAIPAHARVILLGDRDQLASVEAGAVLGDICGAGLAVARSSAPIAGCVVQLTQSYRYAEGSGIARLAEAIQEGRSDDALEVLRDPDVADVTLAPIGPRGPSQRLIAETAKRFLPFLEAPGADQKLRALDDFRVLCAHRHGPFGQVSINAAIEAKLRASGAIAGPAARYAGRPILITQNDPRTRLWNGDVGVLTRSEERLHACFLAADGRMREITPARLPPHESVYAMSVHKSQGSEFEEVAVVLPAEPSPVLSRELLYTAVTRAKKRVVVYGKAEVVKHAIDTAVQRASGLRDALWQS